MVFFYKNYPYAPKATLISGLANGFGYLAGFGALATLISIPKNPVFILPTLLLGALAAFLIVYVGHKLTDKMAGPETEKNITTKPRFAQAYCMANPEAYDHLAEINPEFGQKYMINEKGKCVKRK